MAVDNAIEKLGNLDAIFLNAGISMGQYIEEVEDLSIFHKLMDTNYYQCVCILLTN
jgi:hypothetical protein